MSDSLGVADIARLLDISRPRVWQLRKKPDFPPPAGKDSHGNEYWYDTTIWRWVARSGRSLASKAPLLYRDPPAGSLPAVFQGAVLVNGWLALSWITGLGLVAMVHAVARQLHGPHEGFHRLLPGADVVVYVQPLYDMEGPELEATDRLERRRTYSPRWSDLAELFGSPAPWWPPQLRRPEEMLRWRPGTPQITTPAIPDADTAPLLALANDEPEGSTTRRALEHMAREIQSSATRSARFDADDLATSWKSGSLVLAAVPAATQEPDDDIPEWVLRDGWAQVLRRSDEPAARCVNVAAEWDGGRHLPYVASQEIKDDESSVAAEWRSTLRPCDRTAAFEIFYEPWVATTWTDPATDAPAAEDDSGRLRAAIPQVLPATSALSEVILDAHTVWIRTEDGQLYLAPQPPGDGLNYGYRGSGPHTLTRLVDRLLDDINAGPRRTVGGTSNPGLLALFTTPRTEAAVLTREELLSARDR